MKIRVAQSAYFQGGGIGMYTVELLQALSAREDIDPYLICSPDFEWQDIAGVRVLPGLQRLSHRIPVLRKARFLLAQWANPFRMFRLLRQEAIQVVHLQSFQHISFAQWHKAAERSDVKWVISAHDIRREKAVLNKAWEDEQLKSVYRFADAIMVHSEFQKQELVDFANVSPDRIYLVPHGPYVYDEPQEGKKELRERLGIPGERDVALFFGQIRDDKNLEGFLQALAQSDTSTHLVVAGQAGGRHQAAEYYATLCEQLNIQDRVHFFLRHIPDQEVGAFFKLADWIALPYQTAFTSQSGVLNIAAQYDRPVLVSDAPVLQETVVKSGIGYSCKGDAVENLIQGVQWMSINASTIDKKHFVAYRDTYSWASNAQICSEVYQRILS